MPDAPPDWGADHAAVRALWALDPDVAHLNHGAFGATPRPVLAAQDALRAEMERDPVDFLDDTVDERLAVARGAVAAFLRADPDGLAFVPNATTAVQTVLASLPLGPGDEVVATWHAYPAIRNQLAHLAARTGCTLTTLPVPVAPAGPDELRDAVLAGVSARTRLLVVDHVSSPTALLFPVAAIVAGCRDRGVPVLVDAAHAPGMLDVDLGALAPDYWVGNLHKWACAPKGCGVLYVAAGHRADVRPLVPSNLFGQGFRAELDWTGTADVTPFLAAPAALGLMAGLGWDRVRGYDAALARWGARLVAASIGREPVVDDPRLLGSMAVVDVPVAAGRARDAHLALSREHRVQVPVTPWADRVLLRLSAQAYNRPEEYERLAAALPRVLAAL